MRSCHNIEVSVKKTNGDSAEVNHKPKSQNSLLRSITAKRHKEFDFAIEQYFAGTGKSPEILGNKYFFEMVNVLVENKPRVDYIRNDSREYSYKVKTPQTIRSALSEHAIGAKAQLKSIIGNAKDKEFAVAFDGWSSKIHTVEFLGIGIYFISEEVFDSVIVSAPDGTTSTETVVVPFKYKFLDAGIHKIDKPDAKTMGKEVISVIESYGLDLKNLEGGDGAAVIWACFRDILKVNKFVWCAPHFFQVCIKDAFHESKLFAQRISF